MELPGVPNEQNGFLTVPPSITFRCEFVDRIGIPVKELIYEQQLDSLTLTLPANVICSLPLSFLVVRPASDSDLQFPSPRVSLQLVGNEVDPVVGRSRVLIYQPDPPVVTLALGMETLDIVQHARVHLDLYPRDGPDSPVGSSSPLLLRPSNRSPVPVVLAGRPPRRFSRELAEVENEHTAPPSIPFSDDVLATPVKEISYEERSFGPSGGFHPPGFMDFFALPVLKQPGEARPSTLEDRPEYRALFKMQGRFLALPGGFWQNPVPPVSPEAIAALRLLSLDSTLTSLDLHDQVLGDAGASALSHNSAITFLDLRTNRVGDAGAKALSLSSTLTFLNLARDRWPPHWEAGNEIEVTGAKALALNSILTALDISYNAIGDEGAAAFRFNTVLKSLHLGRNQIGDAGANALLLNTALTILDLGENLVQGAALPSAHNLRWLNLADNRVNDAGARALAGSSTLTFLDLTRTRFGAERKGIGDDGATALANNTVLRSLKLRDNRVGDEGAKALARNTVLTCLDLSGNQVGDEGANALACNSSLTFLALRLGYRNDDPDDAPCLAQAETRSVANQKERDEHRARFIRCMVLLARDARNPESQSPLRRLPLDLRYSVGSNWPELRTSSDRASACARFIFQQIETVNDKLRRGIVWKIVQSYDGTLCRGSRPETHFEDEEPAASPYYRWRVEERTRAEIVRDEEDLTALDLGSNQIGEAPVRTTTLRPLDEPVLHERDRRRQEGLEESLRMRILEEQLRELRRQMELQAAKFERRLQELEYREEMHHNHILSVLESTQRLKAADKLWQSVEEEAEPEAPPEDAQRQRVSAADPPAATGADSPCDGLLQRQQAAEVLIRALDELQAEIRSLPPELTHMRTDCDRRIMLQINQVVATQQKCSSVIEQILAKLHEAGCHPVLLSHCLNTVAHRLLQKAQDLIAAQTAAAFPYALVAVGLCQQCPPLVDVLRAHFYKTCTFTIPRYVEKLEGQSDAQFLEAQGYERNESTNTLEPEEEYRERMSGIVALYAAVVQTVAVFPGDHPFGLPEAWAWLAAISNVEPRRLTALVLNEFLKVLFRPSSFLAVHLTHSQVAGLRLQQVDGEQFRKYMHFLKTEFIHRLPPQTTNADRSRLEHLIDNYERQRPDWSGVGRHLDPS